MIQRIHKHMKNTGRFLKDWNIPVCFFYAHFP